MNIEYCSPRPHNEEPKTMSSTTTVLVYTGKGLSKTKEGRIKIEKSKLRKILLISYSTDP